MLSKKIIFSSENIIKTILIVLAFSIQIQITLFKSQNYVGLRINMTDLLLPFIGLIILFSLFLKKTYWPNFSIKNAYIWLFGLTIILLLSLINSYYSFNELSAWGLKNKFIGWFVLSSFFLMGGWLGTNSKEKDLLLFIKITAIFLITILLIQIPIQLIFFSTKIRIINNSFGSFPIVALMSNKNSFIFLYLTLISFITIFSKQYKIFEILTYIFWLLLPFIFLFTGARSAIITLPIIILMLFILTKGVNWKKTISAFLIGIIACTIFVKISYYRVYSLKPQNIESISHVKNIVSGEKLNKVADNLLYKGDSNRLKMLHHVFGMIKENPIIGSGLGSVITTQERQNGSYIDIIDNTALWLWAETGIFGLLAFLTFYISCFRAIWKKAQNKDAPEFTQAFCMGTILMLITFAIMSLFHEILYTRFLWMFLGIALTLPIQKKC